MTADRANFAEEAENCRRQALEYLGKPEASFLLRIARAFDDLARRMAAAEKLKK